MSTILLIMPSDFVKVDMDTLGFSVANLQDFSAGMQYGELEARCKELGWMTEEQVVDACHYVEETNEFYIKFA